MNETAIKLNSWLLRDIRSHFVLCTFNVFVQTVPNYEQHSNANRHILPPPFAQITAPMYFVWVFRSHRFYALLKRENVSATAITFKWLNFVERSIAASNFRSLNAKQPLFEHKHKFVERFMINVEHSAHIETFLMRCLFVPKLSHVFLCSGCTDFVYTFASFITWKLKINIF